ncbi:hypothetical protein [Natrinema pallidum]|uniref:hypothetical protein n=1 Tax=Natrinema pallidum TaxID=69527 RepID=UPI000AF7A874|nr:hypothetical protein [Natrinema pallidum]
MTAEPRALPLLFRTEAPTRTASTRYHTAREISGIPLRGGGSVVVATAAGQSTPGDPTGRSRALGGDARTVDPAIAVQRTRSPRGQ